MKTLDNNRILTRADSPYPLVLHPKALPQFTKGHENPADFGVCWGAVQILDSGQCNSN